MSEGIKLLKYTLFAESLLGVYRNVSTYGKAKKTLAYIRMSIEISLAVAHGILNAQDMSTIADALFFTSTLINSVSVSLLACLYSQKTNNLLIFLNSNHYTFKGDFRYNKNLNRMCKIFILAATALFIIKICSFISFRIVRHCEIHVQMNSLLSFSFDLIFFMSNFRNIYEYFDTCCILYVMSEQLKYVTRSINEVTNAVTGQNIDDTSLGLKLNIWRNVFLNIGDTSKLYNSIFGVQLTIMIGTKMMYYIVFIYTLISESISGDMSAESLSMYTLLLSIFFLILGIMSQAATQVHNNAEMLRRRLGKLLIYMTNESSYRAAKDLLRLVRTRPIRTQALGAISVDMTLLPKCVMFISYYTVIALQFNNVV